MKYIEREETSYCSQGYVSGLEANQSLITPNREEHVKFAIASCTGFDGSEFRPQQCLHEHVYLLDPQQLSLLKQQPASGHHPTFPQTDEVG